NGSLQLKHCRLPQSIGESNVLEFIHRMWKEDRCTDIIIPVIPTYRKRTTKHPSACWTAPDGTVILINTRPNILRKDQIHLPDDVFLEIWRSSPNLNEVVLRTGYGKSYASTRATRLVAAGHYLARFPRGQEGRSVPDDIGIQTDPVIAKRLGVSRQRVHQWRKKRGIPAASKSRTEANI
ncbi:MAG: hypothetical protein V1857_04275, partial [archaeon]